MRATITHGTPAALYPRLAEQLKKERRNAETSFRIVPGRGDRTEGHSMRKTMTMLAAGALALGAGGMLAACSSDDAAEEAVEEATGGDVDDGSVTFEDEDGSTSIGTCDELPDDFPSDVPTPDADPVACGSTTGGPGDDTWSITYSNDDASAVEDYQGTLEDADFTVDGEFSAGGSEGGFSSFSATNDAYTVTVTSAGAGDEGVINVTVTSASSTNGS